MDSGLGDENSSSHIWPSSFESVEGQPQNLHYFVASLFFAFGISGIWFHGRNISKLSRLEQILPQGVVTLHYHLALANLGMLAVFPFGGISALFNRWLFGEMGCKIYAFEGMVCGLAAIFLVSVLSFVHYADVHLAWKGEAHTYAFVAFSAWVTATVWSIFPLFGFGSYGLEPHRTSCALDMRAVGRLSMNYLIALTILYYAVPMGFAAALSRSLAKSLSLNKDKNQEVRQDRKQLERNIKTNELNIRILLVGFLTWLPLGIFAGITMWLGPPKISPLLYYIPQLSAKLGCALTPFAYRNTFQELDKNRPNKSVKES
jgi:hypothetical protein